ncbi:hypothetical protein [Aeromonas veronii]|uniref:hypothetical protein n=1 Tax=Aeromonas veronii TaxID=654 RepID=UPI003D1F8246
MEDRSSYDYIQLGIIIRLLQNGLHNYKFALKAIEDFEELIKEINFEVTVAMTNSVSYSDLKEIIKEKSISTPDDNMSKDETAELRNIFRDIEKIVFAESSTKNIYTIPSRRYNSLYLLKTPQKLFKQGHFEKLSALAQSDISSSAKCILFGESTASAFHMLRGTEDTLKQYYYLHRKQKRLAKPMWGNMVEQLKAKKNNKPPKPLLDALDMIRANYRNPTQHPEAVYTIDTAQDLFGVCLDVLGKMAEEL